jgi:conjugal transfer pilin signal peptidase TrbI
VIVELKGLVFLINTNDRKIEKGELLAVHVPNTPFYPHAPSFIKYVWGVTGDKVDFDQRGDFFINGAMRGLAKPFSSTGVKLDHSQGGVIPQGRFFGATPHPDSFDSRYKLIGLLNEKAVIGRATRII